jgi:hypothetical protein
MRQVALTLTRLVGGPDGHSLRRFNRSGIMTGLRPRIGEPYRLGTLFRSCLVIACWLCLPGGTSVRGEQEEWGKPFDYGPLACRDTNIHGEQRLRILGPFYEARVSPEGESFSALRPIVSRRTDPAGGQTRLEYLWPLAVVRKSTHEESWRFANIMYTDFDVTDDESRYRFWIFPLVFRGRDAEHRDYMAVFPIAGTANEVMTFDSAEFVFFPLYARSMKSGMVTYDILWPLFSKTVGEDMYRVRIFPFYGRAVKKGESERTFVMWPIWTWARYERPGTSGSAYILFPIFGRTIAENQLSWMLLPPFIRWTEGRGRDRGYSEAQVPWPFLRIGHGKVERFHLWPLVGAQKEAGIRSSFLLWPLVSTWSRTTANEQTDRVVIAPFVQYERRLEGGSGAGEDMEVSGRALKLWPLLSYRQRSNVSSFKAPSLWPALRVQSIEDNVAPLWTLYSRETNGDSVETELLWGLYRYRCDVNESRFSVFPMLSWRQSREEPEEKSLLALGGLLGYSRSEGKSRLHLMYLTLCRSGTAELPVAPGIGGPVK